jgi:hypothetical protein
VQIFIVGMAKYVLSERQDFIVVGLPVDLCRIDAVADMYSGFNRVCLGLQVVSCVQECKGRVDIYLE